MSEKQISLIESSSNTEAAQKANEYHEQLKTDAEERILTKFPERIVYLNELLKKPEFDICANNVDFTLEFPPKMKEELSLTEIDGPDAGKSKHEGDDVPVPESLTMVANKYIFEHVKILKPIIKQLLEDVNSLKIWVALLIPKIEDGNNFGVSIQEETLSEIQHVENDANGYIEQISRYYGTRANLITKVVKYRYVEDYRRGVEELDDRQRLIISLNLHEIRNHYSNLHDIVIKNYEKIISPRTSNIDSLY